MELWSESELEAAQMNLDELNKAIRKKEAELEAREMVISTTEATLKSLDAAREATERAQGVLPESLYYVIEAASYVRSMASAYSVELPPNLSASLDDHDAYFRRKYRETQRHWFKEQYAPEINAHDKGYWAFPYTEISFALIAWEQSKIGNLTDKEARTLVDSETWEAFKAAHANVLQHAQTVLKAISTGAFIGDDGKDLLPVEDSEVNLAPVIEALHADGYDNEDIFGDHQPRFEFGENVITRVDTDYSSINMGYFGTAYLVLYALVSLLGLEKHVRGIIYPTKRERKGKNLTTKTTLIPNDAVTNALFGRDSNAIEASDYHGGEEKAITIVTGKGATADLRIVNDLPFDAAISAYRLSPIDRFWLEAVCSIAANDGGEPVREIRGTDLLKFNGYKNPYQDSTRPTLLQSLQSVSKMTSVIRVAIDTTSERRKYRGVVESYLLQPVIDANVELVRFDDDTVDYVIHLSRNRGDDALDALPLARYASDKKQIIAATKKDLEFRTLKRLNVEHRMMWRYVWRRIRENRTSNTIVFDTIFKNLDLQDIERHKRAKMLTVLHKMLEERQADGVLEFKWNRDKGGKREYSVTVELIDQNAGEGGKRKRKNAI